MIRKIAYLGVVTLLISSIVSCEQDYVEPAGTSIVNNSKFTGNKMDFDITMTSRNITEVAADNINATIGEYLLGVYKPDNYKQINASIITQLAYSGVHKTKDLISTDDIDSTYVLDKVLIKLPYPVIKKTDGTYELNSVIGNTNVDLTIKVFQNESYLNIFNPVKPSKKNSYGSNYAYTLGDNLTENSEFKFMPKISTTEKEIPFLEIPLDKVKMKSLFWDKFGENEFASSEAFQSYCKGLIIKAEGIDGALIPFDFSKTSGKLEFIYKIECSGSNTDVINGSYSFGLNGVRNSIYEMGASKITPANNVAVQGTSGSMAKINISDAQIDDIRNKNVLINDATLTFYVNNDIDKDTTLVPKKLLLYRELDEGGIVTNQHISDSYTPGLYEYFGGYLENTNGLPEKYTFHVTDYLVSLIKGKKENTPLLLKVYNKTTDLPALTSVKTYNWNPRGVTLRDPKLEIFYSEENKK